MKTMDDQKNLSDRICMASLAGLREALEAMAAWPIKEQFKEARQMFEMSIEDARDDGIKRAWAQVAKVLDDAGFPGDEITFLRLRDYIKKNKESYHKGYGDCRKEVNDLLDGAGAPREVLSVMGRLGDYIEKNKSHLSGSGKDMGLVEIARDGYLRGVRNIWRDIDQILDDHGAATGGATIKWRLIDALGDAIIGGGDKDGYAEGRASVLRTVKGIVDVAIGCVSDEGPDQILRLRGHIEGTMAGLKRVGREGFEAGKKEERRRIVSILASFDEAIRDDTFVAIVEEIEPKRTAP